MMADMSDHYWIIGRDKARVWSSAARKYIPVGSPAYRKWLAGGNRATPIKTERLLWGVLSQQAPDRLPDAPAAQDVRKERALDAADAVLFRLAFNQENRIRALEGKQPVKAAQFRAAIKTVM